MGVRGVLSTILAASILLGCVPTPPRTGSRTTTVSVPGNKDYDAMEIEIVTPWRADTKYSLSGLTISSEGVPGIKLRVAAFANPPDRVVKQIKDTVPGGQPIEGNGYRGVIVFPDFKGKLAIGTGFLVGNNALVAVQIEANEMVHADDRDAITHMICSVRATDAKGGPDKKQ